MVLCWFCIGKAIVSNGLSKVGALKQTEQEGTSKARHGIVFWTVTMDNGLCVEAVELQHVSTVRMLVVSAIAAGP